MANNSAVIVTAAPVDHKGMECEYAPERKSKECLAHIIHCVEGRFWGDQLALKTLAAAFARSRVSGSMKQNRLPTSSLLSHQI